MGREVGEDHPDLISSLVTLKVDLLLLPRVLVVKAY